MSDFIAELAGAAGIEAEKAELASGALLKTIESEAPSADFQQLLGKLPGASDWMSKAAAATGSEAAGSGGAGLLGAAAGMLGGSQGAGLGALVSQLGKLGLDGGTAAKFLPAALPLLQKHAGGELFQKLVSAVPMLGQAGKDGGGGSALGAVGKLFG